MGEGAAADGKAGSKGRPRVAYIDVARGFAILLMVVGHTIDFGLGRDLIFAWHMPLFVLVSGMFISDGTSVARTLRRNARKLLLPYAGVGLVVQGLTAVASGGTPDVGQLIVQVVAGMSFSQVLLPGVPSIDVIWFIPFLMVVQLVFLAIIKLAGALSGGRTGLREMWKALLSLAATLAGIMLGVRGLWLPWSADVALASVGFMYIGHQLTRQHVADDLFGSQQAVLSGRTLASMALLAVAFALGFRLGVIELAVRWYPGGLCCMATAVAGCMLVFWVSALIEHLWPLLCRGLAWCGRNSLYLLMAHAAEKMLVPYEALGITGTWELLLARFLVIAAIMALVAATRQLKRC